MATQTQLKWLALGATGLLGAASLFWQKHEKRGRGLLLGPSRGSLVDAARTLNRGAGLLAFSVVLDSAMEHYRGDFQNRAMYTRCSPQAYRCWLAGTVSRTTRRGPIACAMRSTWAPAPAAWLAPASTCTT